MEMGKKAENESESLSNLELSGQKTDSDIVVTEKLHEEFTLGGFKVCTF